ncbi:unnamed protein product [Ilex paraguariensis]|uniref:KANL3/Tex30 alpha/beta hydrolase-like domain-containing protein n=1 Tax=Ilex paraguariensis TaxID=185542 RepID=A0ABC8T0T7_9AQUA
MVATRSSKRKRTSQNEANEDKEEQNNTNTTDNTSDDLVKKKKKNTNKNSPVVIFAHGAGAPSSSDWMIRWKDLLAKALQAVEVVTFDYPYISGEKRKAPPKAEKLVDFHSDIVKKTVAKYPGHPLILVGKSMGSRVSCMVAGVEDIGASAIVCLGYPLKVCHYLWISIYVLILLVFFNHWLHTSEHIKCFRLVVVAFPLVDLGVGLGS